MHKTLIGLGAAAAVGLATLAGPSPANAGCYGCAVGAGILGGVAAGAIAGAALASPYYYPYGYYGYYPYGYPYYGHPCYWRRVWNGYAWVRACV